MNNIKNSISVKIKRIICALSVPIIMCSCAKEDIPEETTSQTTGSVTESTEYALVRRWTGSELMNSIFFCGEYHPLPIVPEENEDLFLYENIMIFPDDSFAYAVTDEESGIVTGLTFERGYAPQDLSVYGIDFSSRPDDIPEKVGIASQISGDKDETISYSFYGGGIGELTFVYTDKMLASITISAES